MGNVIRVTGKANKSFAPDMQKVKFSYVEIKNTYEEAMQLLREKNEEINKQFETIGFTNKELKLANFSIDKEYESYEENVNEKTYYKKKFIGFKLRLDYMLDSKHDGVLLGKILNEISNLHCEDNNDYSSTKVSYFLDNFEKYKNEVLKLAINDCKEKAKLLADSSGVGLGETEYIEYSWNNVKIGFCDDEDDGYRYNCCLEYKGSYSKSIDINPRDIDVDAEVNMVFAIEN